MRLLVLILVLFLTEGAIFATTVVDPEAAPHDGTEVVVTQGNVRVTLGDIDAFAESIPKDKRAEFFNSPQRIESVLSSLLVTKELADQARSLGLDKRPEVQAQISRSTDMVLSQRRTEALRSELEKKIPNMTELARERYQANPEAYEVPAQIDVKHILISTKDRSDAEAKELATRLYSDLKKDPSSFDADVTKYSDDSSKASNHGLIENATSDHLVKPFREAAAKLEKPGELSPPVKTTYGYHILKVISVKPAHQRSFAEVEPRLVETLQKDWVAEKVQDRIDGLRSQKIDAVPELVASLRDRYDSNESSKLPTPNARVENVGNSKGSPDR